MADFQVYFENSSFRRSWVAWNDMADKYIATTSTQKEAVNKAVGQAQQYANRQNKVAKVEIYQKNGSHKKTKRIEPTGSSLLS